MDESQDKEKGKNEKSVAIDSPPSPDPAARNPLSYDNKTLYIYCPPELAMDFIDFANKEFGGKQYIALKELIRTWREMRHMAYMLADVRDLSEEMQTIRERLTMLENKAWPVEEEEKAEEAIPTMGGKLKVKK